MRAFRRGLLAVCWLGLAFGAAPATADDLIVVSVDSVRRDSGNSFVDLLEDALSQEGAFTDLQITPNYQLDFDYLGVRQAIQFSASLTGSQVTLSIPSTGFSRVFSGASADDIEQQVEDWAEEEGARELARFLEEVNGRSPIAVLDGNPRSTTALLARGAFDRFGFGAPRTRAGYERGLVAKWGHFDLQAEVSGGAIEVDDFSSLSVVDGALTLAGDFSPGIGLSFSILGQYRDFDGAKIYDAGLELGIPVSILVPNDRAPIRWVVTPFVQSGAGVALDLAAGGLMLGGGVVSSASYNLGAFEWMMANEIAYYGGIPIKNIGGYEFDTELDRLILRNGGKVAWHLARGAFVEAGISVTNFVVGDAAVDVYGTPFLGAGIALGFVHLRAGWESDLGDDYEAHIGKAEIALEF